MGKDARKVAPLERHADVHIDAERDPVSIPRGRTQTGCRGWCRSGTGGCSSRRSRFFRGAAAVTAADLAATPVSGLRTQTCGDGHLSNFGLFASAERTLEVSLTGARSTSPKARLRPTWSAALTATSRAGPVRDLAATGTPEPRPPS
jgi:hypothetical protein